MSPDQREAKRKYDREAKARQRAAMSAEERAAARRQHDENYRNAHRWERQDYDRERAKRIAQGRWKFPGVQARLSSEETK